MQLFFLGGHSNSSATPLSSGWVLNTDTGKWKELTAMIGKAMFWFKIYHWKVTAQMSVELSIILAKMACHGIPYKGCSKNLTKKILKAVARLRGF